MAQKKVKAGVPLFLSNFLLSENRWGEAGLMKEEKHRIVGRVGSGDLDFGPRSVLLTAGLVQSSILSESTVAPWEEEAGPHDSGALSPKTHWLQRIAHVQLSFSGDSL